MHPVTLCELLKPWLHRFHAPALLPILCFYHLLIASTIYSSIRDVLAAGPFPCPVINPEEIQEVSEVPLSHVNQVEVFWIES